MRGPYSIAKSRELVEGDAKAGKRWLVAEDARLVQLWRDGKTFAEIAASLDVGRVAAIGRLHRLAAKSADLKAEMTEREQTVAETRTAASLKAKTERRNRECAKSAVTKLKRAQTASARPSAPTGPSSGFQPLHGEALEQRRNAEAAAIRQAHRAEIWASIDEREPVPLVDLGAGCKWPIGDPLEPGFGFCGAERAEGKSPYCPHHHAIAYTAAPDKPPAPVDVSRVPSRGDRLFMGSLG